MGHMPLRIEDYALIGDTQSAALVGRDGSIDWMCLPRFDSDACFAALLGGEQHGRWKIAPRDGVRAVRRRYRPGSLVLETTFETEDGAIRLIDCMPPRWHEPDVVRVIEGVSGSVPVRVEMNVRFGYGSTIPWIRRGEGRITALAGPEAVSLYTSPGIALDEADGALTGDLQIAAGQRATFLLAWHPSTEAPPEPSDPCAAVEETEAWWTSWCRRCTLTGAFREHVLRSLITLKALTFLPTGGIVAAPTTSLPEKLGGVRNWDYRFCWVRDATITLLALMESGFDEEASAWCDWLLRAVAGHPSQYQIMYGIRGERRLPEIELRWLPGYEGSAPVRIGNAAVDQLQLDTYGEVMDCFHQARKRGIQLNPDTWELQRGLLDFLERHWQEPDEGIWEMRGPRRCFTHSRVMAWVAFDRAVRGVERFGLEGPVDRWRQIRAEIHQQVCERGHDAARNTFTQHYGSRALDASLLMIPQVGFLPVTDPRVIGTIEAIQRELVDEEGFVLRYPPDQTIDGQPHGEGAFLPCTAWLADALALLGRRDEARRLFEKLLSLANDVGLFSEEYDAGRRRLVGNFPQAFTHVSIVNTARTLAAPGGPSARRSET